MIKTIRVMLIPNNKQETRMFQYADTARFAYNWALAKEKENSHGYIGFISDAQLRKEFTQLKKKNDYSWLNKISNNVTKQAIKDACDNYKRFCRNCFGKPKFKSRKHTLPSFYQDVAAIQFSDTHVKLEGLAGSKKKNKQKFNWVKLAEHGRIPINGKYKNPRIKYDGINWYITVGIEYESSVSISPSDNDGIGIDLGIKNLAVCSDGTVYQNINKTKTVRKLEKRKRRLQCSISRSYEKNKKRKRYHETENLIKKKKDLLKVSHKMTNIRQNYLHQITTKIVKTKPSYIVLEDLSVKSMMKNKCLSKVIRQQMFYEFRKQIQYKSEWNNIRVVIADRFFPSSKLCCCCGHVKENLKLSDRIYECDCGNIVDRDFQAALNLKRYGKNALKFVA